MDVLLVAVVEVLLLLLLVLLLLLLTEVGDWGDSMRSGVRLPSEPSLDSEEGGVKGKPYVEAFVLVTEALVFTNVALFVMDPSDLMVILGMITL